MGADRVTYSSNSSRAAEGAAPWQRERAMQRVAWDRYATFFVLAIAGCAVDLWTKHWIFGKLGMPRQSDPIWLVDEVFGLETHLNEGALFGVGQGQTAMFAALSIGAAIGVLWWLFWAKAAEDRLLTVALGMVTGGIFGNLYDRLGLHHLTWAQEELGQGHAVGDRVFAVRDWLHFKLDSIGFDWPVFNIADSLLVCGAGLLLLHALLASRKADPAARDS
jgi:signal peptidase II